jgi:glucoamylase
MLATWIESAAKGRLGGPVRAGMWSAAVIGTHPIQENQRAWVEVFADDRRLGVLPAYWIENKGANSFWHAPLPPQAVGTKLRYRAIVDLADGTSAQSPFQDTLVRPNLPDRTESNEALLIGAEALVGNRMMTVRVDGRGSTYDIYFPTVGLHSFVRPREGDQPQSRCHFRAITGGLAVGRRLDWFSERAAWEPYQSYQGVTNLLTTKLSWRHGPIQVLIVDFAAMGDCLPKNAGNATSPGQYIKRFLIKNGGTEPRRAVFAVYVQAEVNGGVGDVGLSWHDLDRALLAINRGHAHSNRKLARDATIEFAIALDDRGDVECEPTGPNEALIYRAVDLPAGATVAVDMLVSGAFTGWSGDRGTFAHWLRPALAWFRSSNLDLVEHATAREWDEFLEPVPDPLFPKPAYAVHLRRSALAGALHADAEWGGIASGFDRGLSAYCWPRDAIRLSGALDRLGHYEIGRGVYQWLFRVRQFHRAFLYWFQKYSIDGVPEWETPAVDQTALVPWGLERHYRRTGNKDLVAAVWPMIEQAAAVCCGDSGGHPGLRMLDDLGVIYSAGSGDQLFGAFLYSNACVVAGLRAAARLATELGLSGSAELWQERAARILQEGILKVASLSRPGSPGFIDPDTGRLLQARRLSRLRGLWTSDPNLITEHSRILDINMLGLAQPFGLLPASDPVMVRTAEGILRANDALRGNSDVLTHTTYEPPQSSPTGSGADHHEVSTVATLWMVRYLLQLGRETGQGRHWTHAITMLEAILGRISQLGLTLRAPGRGMESARNVANPGGMGWRLHGMLIETMMDLAGLEYDAVARRIILRPVLPGQWPQTGVKQALPCGEVSYRLERPIGGKVYQLTVGSELKHEVALDVGLTCPDLKELGPWQGPTPTPAPALSAATGRLEWSVILPAGSSQMNWTWG